MSYLLIDDFGVIHRDKFDIDKYSDNYRYQCSRLHGWIIAVNAQLYFVIYVDESKCFVYSINGNTLFLRKFTYLSQENYCFDLENKIDARVLILSSSEQDDFVVYINNSFIYVNGDFKSKHIKIPNISRPPILYNSAVYFLNEQTIQYIEFNEIHPEIKTLMAMSYKQNDKFVIRNGDLYLQHILPVPKYELIISNPLIKFAGRK